MPWQTGGNQEPVSLDFSWVIEKKTRAEEEVKGQRKVILLGSPRTGSTLLGELLASHSQTSYFMEPLFAMMPLGQLDWNYVLEGKIERGEVPLAAVTALMEGIFSCDQTVIQRLEDWSRVPHTSVSSVPVSVCRSSQNLLAKVVRLHGVQAGAVVSQVEEVKVVHIVRDPRGVTASLRAQQEEWGERTGEDYCRNLLADIALENQLGPERYIRVRYEDLVEDPMKVLERIGAFLGVAVTEEMREAVGVRMFGKKDGTEVPVTNSLAASNTTEYYSTVRGPGHRHDSWRQRLRPEDISVLECGVCGEVMERLGYHKLTTDRK